eukprot:INCI857.1.p1 GENE.INCI857.1~~INCI857.1.p1  ORF type:complete len:313 (+),score=60.50 INCI857.1:99-1037(+)
MATTPPPRRRPTGEPVDSNAVLESAQKFADKLSRRAADDVEVECPVEGLSWCPVFAAKFRNVLSESECRKLIELSEAAGYEQALVNVGGGRQKLIQDYRNSHRMMLDSEPLALAIFDRIRSQLLKALAGSGLLPEARVGTPLEFNERLRFLRYTGGEFFEQHFDGCYARPRDHPKAGDRSYLTVLLYLNAGYEGSTRLFNTKFGAGDDSYYDVAPEPGMVFVHEHRILHSGQPITRGTKYVIRTDIMFCKSGERVEAAEAAAAARRHKSSKRKSSGGDRAQCAASFDGIPEAQATVNNDDEAAVESTAAEDV